MAETPLKALKPILETIRQQADFALEQLEKSEEERSMRWKCKQCNYIKHFTRPVPC
jgi:rubrerythrin